MAASTSYETFIGLEIHIQLLTETKIFCGCKSKFGDKPNSNVCPVCLGYPGVLPALNEHAVELSYKVCRAMNCDLAKEGMFERKNYFYPDLTKNYQISQFEKPFGRNGYFEYESGGGIKRIRFHEIHLEEDAGKMIHQGGRSFCDYNRAGTCLLEIVTEPEFKEPQEAEDFLQAFRRTVRHLGVCDGNMEEGSLRCDANISINTPGAGLGVKTEVKNLNSSRFVKKALQYERRRQEKVLKSGGKIIQETRLWDEDKSVTESMRTKEEAHDYRYFPEPDLPPFRPDQAFFDMIEKSQIELPLARKQRLTEDYGLTPDQADYIVEEKAAADYFEAVVALGADAKTAAKWIMGNVAKELNRIDLSKADLGTEKCALSAERLTKLLGMLADNKIHGKIAAQTLAAIFNEDKDPEVIVKEQGWDSSADEGDLEKIVQQILDENPRVVEQIRGGDQKPRGFVVGKVMKATQGTANPQSVQSIIGKLIG
ncbi:MAG: Asp-tRNA(Asn)/Glu-tRNA(Gln) amidotransferase subunit GatB [Spirochaetales bacterium]|uniref:Aspartyl/glutamyl-tRNA(Asn/Gln) amidotransferase subunit B n=1 Tax=Candidatus Thalassospirochaeta sargassi TaxID=3119039 RepID=A0AAJ1MIC7_9SPIO|nr:Asp-tRNA(Asn)/Glu-tRNA(Gln) amidotransferase subunit GatB [Spirochaetales bacterium]